MMLMRVLCIVSTVDYTLGAARLGLNETQTSKTFSANFAATDVDGDTITYSLSSTLTGLTIGSTTGVVNYSGVELDQDGSNPVTSYDLTVTATSNGKSTTKDAVLVIGSVNEAPVFAVDSYDVDENASGVIFTVNAVDPEGTAVVYSLVSSPPDGFSIDSASGEVSYTGVGLDYETQDEYSLTVRAASNGQNTNQVVTVNILDVNEAPVVSAPIADYNVKIGLSQTIDITAIFSDEDGDALTYSVTVNRTSGAGGDPLVTVDAAGVLSVDASSLSVADEGEFEIEIMATDGSLSVVDNFSLTLLDDADPVFSDLPYEFTLSENDTAETFSGTTIAATDPDGDVVTLSLVAAEGATDVPAGFVLTNGILSYSSVSGIDREALPEDGVLIVRVQAAANGTTVFQDIEITITDVDEFDVVFPQATLDAFDNLSIDENLDGSTTAVPLMTVEATDGDGDSVITYSLTNPVAGVSIDTDTGDLTYTGSGFNHENTASYSFDVVATSGSNTVTKAVTLTVNDVDENAPVFTSTSPVSLSIDENDTAETFSPAFEAMDADGTNNTVTYSLDTDAPTGFSITADTGVLSYADSAGLDAETATSHVFNVIATSNGVETKQAVTLTVSDVDESNVAFDDATYNFTLDENTDSTASPTYEVSATDADVNSDISYSITDSSVPFSIDADSGDISYTGSGVDRETTSSFSFTVSAVDTSVSNAVAATATVNIAVNDINEVPVVSDPITDRNVKTGVVDTVDLTAIFSDEDAGAVLTYSATAVRTSGTGSSPSLTIDAAGVLSIDTSSLSVADEGAYTVEITATDGLLSVSYSFVLTLTNDNAPVFTGTPYAFNLAENDVDHVFATIAATDADGDVIAFSLVPAPGATEVPAGFEISSTGVFSYDGVGIDREALPADGVIVVWVRAESNGVTVFESVQITVTDVDDNDPVFTQTTLDAFAALSIDENLDASGTAVSLVTVVATDADIVNLDEDITYALDNSTLADLSIDAGTGEIQYTGGGLNRETTATYSFDVVATSGSNTVTKTVTLNVNDVDDNAPVFTNTQNYTIPSLGMTIGEDATSKTFAINLRATDADATNNTIVYSISTALTGLTIDSATGEASYSGVELDQDATGAIRNYTFSVTATSNAVPGVSVGQSVSRDVILSVVQKDEFDPAFASNAVSSLSIDENQTSADFGTFTATDADYNHGTIRYTLSGTAPSGLSIGNTSGVLSYSNVSGLDAETTTSVTFDLIATANGQTGRHTITLNVNDVDENAPVFTSTSPVSLSIDENDTAETFTPAFAATDGDTTNNTVTYSLDTDAPTGFTITADTGVLSYAGVGLDAETAASHVFNVIATSNGVETKQAVTLTVNDVDDVPEFENTPYNFTLEENATSFLVGQVVAVDPDNVGNITYSIDETGGAVPFSINIVTGAVSYTGVALNYEDVLDPFSLTVLASDTTTTNAVTVNVSVIDVNEAPTVSGGIKDRDVTPNQQGSFSIDLNAFDDEDADTLFYSGFTVVDDNGVVVATPPWLSFSLDTGEFTINNGVEGIYNVTVTAADRADNTALTVTDTFKLNITATGAPVFSSSSYELFLSENVDATNNPLTLGEITAVDVGAIISYKLLQAGSNFSITTLSNGSGMIQYSGSAYDYEALGANTSIATLLVQATSYDGIVERIVTKSVAITIADVNEAPEFENISYNFTLEENATGFFVGQVTANDPEGAQSSLTYSIDETGGAVPFSIDASTGDINYTGVALNYEDALDPLTFAVQVSDSVSTDTVMVSVSVVDVNDAPAVSGDIADQVISANFTQSFSIDLNAFGDEDADTLFYSGFTIADENGVTFSTPSWLSFSLATGEFTVTNGVVGIYNVTVAVADRADNTALTGTGTFELTVFANELPEFYNTPYNFNLSENDDRTNNPLSLGNVLAADFGTTIAYDLIEVVAGEGVVSGFSITSSGTIQYSGSAYDYEALGTDKYITLRVQATSTSGEIIQTATQNIIINIIDVNEVPEFENTSYAFTLEENVTGVFVGQVTADDPEAQSLTYSIDETGGAVPFSIDVNTGEINYTGVALNYEDALDPLTFAVQVSDSVGTNTVMVSVSVVDVNDAPTVFDGIPNKNVDAGVTQSFAIDSNAFDDEDSDTLSYSFTITDEHDTSLAIPSWLSLSQAGEFTVTNGTVGFYKITVTAYDRGDNTALTVNNTFLLVVGGGISIDNVNSVLSGEVIEKTFVGGDATGTIVVSTGAETTYSIGAQGSYGIASVDSSGNWVYSLDDSNAEVAALSASGATQSLTTSFIVNIEYMGSSVTQNVNITVNGIDQIDVTGDDLNNNLGDSTSTEVQYIQGLQGNDVITAGSGGDVIAGGYGDDTITLGGGADTVVYRLESDLSNGTNRYYLAVDGGDIITEFELGVDKIVFFDEATNSTKTLESFAADFERFADPDQEVGLSIIADVTQDGIAGVRIDFGEGGTEDGTSTSNVQTGNVLTIAFTENIDFATFFAGVGDTAVYSAGEYQSGYEQVIRFDGGVIKKPALIVNDILALEYIFGSTADFDGIDFYVEGDVNFEVL